MLVAGCAAKCPRPPGFSIRLPDAGWAHARGASSHRTGNRHRTPSARRLPPARLPNIAAGNEFKRSDFIMNLLRRGAGFERSLGAKRDARIDIDGVPFFPKWSASAFGNREFCSWLGQEKNRGTRALRSFCESL